MKIKQILLILSLYAGSLPAQNEWVLQPWISAEGTYAGQRLGSFVTKPLVKSNFNFRALISDIQKTGCYTFSNINDTSAKKTIFGNDIITGDLNNDGYTDIVMHRRTNDYDTIFVYWGIATGVDTLHPLIFPGENQYDGLHATTIADVNNDGKNDLILCASGYPNLVANGKVYIYLNPVNKSTPDYALIGDTVRAGLGFNTAVGDLNGDQLNDLIVKGTHQTGSTDKRYDYVNIYFGKPGTALNLTLAEQLREAYIASTGLACFDINGDGVSDLLWASYTPIDSQFCIRVYFGKPNFDTIPSMVLKDPKWGLFDAVLINAGDVNGDGYNDLVVGTPGHSFDFGGVLEYSGGPNMDGNFDAAAARSVISQFGITLTGIGDVNGDGYADILVGAPSTEWNGGLGYWVILLGSKNIPVTTVKEITNVHPLNFEVLQNYPNPFNSSTTITYTLKTDATVRLTIYNVLSQKLNDLVHEEQVAGEHKVTFDADDYSSGVYFYKLTAVNKQGNSQTETKQMTLMK